MILDANGIPLKYGDYVEVVDTSVVFRYGILRRYKNRMLVFHRNGCWTDPRTFLVQILWRTR